MFTWTSIFLFCCLVAVAIARPDLPIIYPQGISTKYFDSSLQTTCVLSQGYGKIATGKSGLAAVTTDCQILPLGWTTLIQVNSYNPTGDDTYSVLAYYWEDVTPLSNGCQINAGTQSCDYLGNSTCYPQGGTTSPHMDYFNITTCSQSSAAFVEFGCLATPGAFNDHCEISYSIGVCGSTFTNSPELFPSQCQY